MLRLLPAVATNFLDWLYRSSNVLREFNDLISDERSARISSCLVNSAAISHITAADADAAL